MAEQGQGKSKPMDVAELARDAMAVARKQGAQACAVNANRTRSVEVTWRDGRLEQVTEATERALEVQLYVDGRYSVASTSDLRPEAMASFLADAIAMARTLAPDPHRALPDPSLYAGQAAVDLASEDPAQARLTPDERKRFAREVEAAARATDAKGAILSVTSAFEDGFSESFRVASNGFEGRRRQTYFGASAEVAAKDADGRRPEGFRSARTRHLADLPPAAEIGAEAGRRALGRLGQVKGKSAKMVVVVENQTVGRLLGGMLAPLTGGALQQKRSFLDGKLGQTLGGAQLTLTDDPHLPRGLASRLWDGEGMATRRRPIVEAGVLRTFFIDTYYGRKLGVAPTTAGPSNVVWSLGTRSLEGLIADARDGIFITGFLGGNNNQATGDFSMGILGHRIAGGKLAEPIGEMNIAGNYLGLLPRLAAVGNDPWVFASHRAPSILLDGVSIAGA